MRKSRGRRRKIVMSVTKGNAPIIGKKQYKTVKDLDGKKVGTPGLGTIHDAVLSYIQRSQNLKFQHVPAKITDVAIMIQKGEVEAFIGWEPASAAAVARAPELLKYISGCRDSEAESLQLAFTPEYVKNNTETARVHSRNATGIVDKVNGNQKTAELISKS